MRTEHTLDSGPFPPLVRVFIAVAIPPAQQELVQGLAKTLAECKAKVSWTKPNALHITLKFLGEIPQDDIAVVKNALDPILSGISNFPIAIQGLGRFPPKGAPRIAWLGIHDGAEQLTAVANNIDVELVKLGFSGETRPWTPHITIGRIHSTYRTYELVELMENTSTDGFEPFNADVVLMMRSQLGRGTPIHSKLAVWELDS